MHSRRAAVQYVQLQRAIGKPVAANDDVAETFQKFHGQYVSNFDVVVNEAALSNSDKS